MSATLSSMNFWVMKTEPEVFSIQDLVKRPNQEEFWDGVRNYQARNYLRDSVKAGDNILFYHSNATPSGIAGTASVVGPAATDTSAQNTLSPYFDEKLVNTKGSKKIAVKNPWVGVTVGKPKVFDTFVELLVLREYATQPEFQFLAQSLLLKKGNRLSVFPVSMQEFKFIELLGTGKKI